MSPELAICVILTENLKLDMDNGVVYSLALGKKCRSNGGTLNQLLIFFI